MTKNNEVFNIVRTAGITAISTLLFLNLIARPIRIEGNSMYPTLETDSLGLANIIGRNLYGLERFDIVIIHIDGEDERNIIKRIVGLPGEKIQYKNGILYVNGAVVAEPFLKEGFISRNPNGFAISTDEIELGEDEYYCVGDNRPASRDSREIGPIKNKQIIAKNMFVK